MSVQDNGYNNDEIDLGLELSDNSSEDILDVELDDLDIITPLPDNLNLGLEPEESEDFDIELEDISDFIVKDMQGGNLLTEGVSELVGDQEETALTESSDAPTGRSNNSIMPRKQDRVLTSTNKTAKYLTKLYEEASNNIGELTDKVLSIRSQNSNITDFENFMLNNKPPKIRNEALGRIRGFIMSGGLNKGLTIEEIIEQTRVGEYITADVDKLFYKDFLYKSYEERIKSSKALNQSHQAVRKKIDELNRNYFFKDLYDVYPYMKAEDARFVFVDKIYLSSESEDFVCGECHERSHASHPFVSVILTANNDNKRNIPWFVPNVCSHCGAVNSLSDMEFKVLDKQIRSELNKREVKVDTIDVNSEGVPTVVRYKLDNSFIASLIPDVFSIDVEEIKERVDTTKHDISDSVKRYKDKVFAFYNKNKISSIPEGTSNNTELMTRTLCNMTGHVYSSIKVHAVNSLLAYIHTSSVLYDILSENTNKMYSVSIDNIKYLDRTDLEPHEYETIIRNICFDLGVKYEEVLNEDKTLNKEVFNSLKKDIQEAKIDIDEQIKYNNHLRDITIDHLTNNKILYSYLLVSQISSIDPKIERDLIRDKRVAKWIDDVSELMILNSITEDLIPFWTSNSTCKLDKKLNKFLGSYDSEAVTKKLASILESIDSVANKTKSYFVNDIKDYLLYYTTTISPFYCFRRLRNDFKSFSTFKIMQGLHGCLSLLNTSMLEVPYMHDLKSMLVTFEDKVKSFVNKNGVTDLDYFKFVFPFLGEADSSVRASLIREYEKYLFIIKPLEGETPMEYYERYRHEAPNKYVNDEDVTVIEDTEFISEITKYCALIYGSTHIFDYCSENVSDFRIFILFKDIILHSTRYDRKDVFRCMGINPNFVSYLSNLDNYNFEINPKNLDKDYIDMYLVNCVYPDDELNDIRNDSDLTNESKISEIVRDKDRLLEISTFFDEKERSLINEYYIARGQEI